MPHSISVNNFTASPISFETSESGERTDSHRHLRVLFWGISCEFSHIVFAQILQHSLMDNSVGRSDVGLSIEVCAVFLPDAGGISISQSGQSSLPSGRNLPADVDPVRRLMPTETTDPHELVLHDRRQAPDLVQIAQTHSIPVYTVSNLDHPKTAALLASLAVDVACVTCYPNRIPLALLSIPFYGSLNVHPSLLPQYRGPAPLFWIMRNGKQSSAAGATVHWMDERLDTGPIAAQQALELPDGISGPAADRQCAMLGARLLIRTLDRLQSRWPQAIAELDRQPQPANGSYDSWPQPSDFALDLSWSAQRAFNFMRGTKSWGYPYFVLLDGERVVLLEALAVEDRRLEDRSFEDRKFEEKGKPHSLFAWQDDKIYIQFAIGLLCARPAL